MKAKEARRGIGHRRPILRILWSGLSAFTTLSVLSALSALAAFSACSHAPAPEPARSETARRPALIERSYQLTFAGRRSGEGYFSRDGLKLVFQSEREPGNPFDQIYRMDLASGWVERVSPGVGKATCGWIHPGGGRVLFASTHLDPSARDKQVRELEVRATGEERRYAWDFDSNYELFWADPTSGTIRRLTRTPGYDAEASWSPDGRRILFASNRSAYAEPLDSTDRERLDRDPSSFVDLYIMNSDGSDVRRLTQTPGYDGGPFFSPDGRRIVWRRFSEDGARAEIFSMRVDGDDIQQLTHLDAMSWAPFYHPSGDYIVFATNTHGFSNFELYLVDAEGQSAPVRVTDNDGFDGLPAYSPDGSRLAWTRTRGQERSQIFVGGWNDAEARRLLGLPARHDAVASQILPLPAKSSPEITASDLRAHVASLSSEASQGRLAGTPGEKIATSYVARAFRAAGLEPAGDRGTFFQEFGFSAGVSLGEGNRLELEASGANRAFRVGEDWRPLAFSQLGSVPPTEVVFAGYGIVAPAGGGLSEIDDYAHLDVRGRWVLAFRFAPSELNPSQREHLQRHTSLRAKAMVARDRGALGLLVVSGPNSNVERELVDLRLDASLAGTSLAAVSLSDGLADELVRPSGLTLEALHDASDRPGHAVAQRLASVRVSTEIDLQQQRRRGRNVLARLSAGTEPSRLRVVVGAHIDHLGHGDGARSLARPEERGQIHPGADDNASGVAAVLEVAQSLAHRHRAGDLKLARDVVFAAWSGEELGLLGSSHYASELVGDRDPHASLSSEVAAYLNLDMVGRLEDTAVLYGIGTSSRWRSLVERANASVGLPLRTREDSHLPTDATPFTVRRVPVLSLFTGVHGEYHTPRDTADRIAYDGLRQIAQLVEGLASSVATLTEPIDHIATTSPDQFAPRAGLRVYLGTIPDYAKSDVRGVALAGVVDAGPADRAGILPGDVVVEVAGRAIENLYDYTYALETLTAGEPAELVLMRGETKHVLSIVPGSRQ